MLILGFNGGVDLIDEMPSTPYKNNFHDSSAALIEDGKIVFAIEEERLNMIKHSTKFPILSIKSCLSSKGICLKDLDAITYYGQSLTEWLRLRIVENPSLGLIADQAPFMKGMFEKTFGESVSLSKFHFILHHLAHAMSAYCLSGFENSLCLTIDGMGDGSAGKVYDIKRSKIKELCDIPIMDSMGSYYLNVIGFLGYGLFDEYKVMGLAPYGNPGKFRKIFTSFYKLYSKGEFEIIDSDKIFKKLCLAGGVAHNCTVNGKILQSGLFKNIFIQPAAHDAGCAIGSALYYHHKYGQNTSKTKLKHVYLGTDIGENEDVAVQLEKWDKFLLFRRSPDVIRETASLLANGKVIGWVQGKSEFGPRALGNRSILADPRPERNKERINQLIKKREGYRPFAPSILEEVAEKYFTVDMTNETTKHQMGYMLYVLSVKKRYRKVLGAITHVDGTARIQTVSKETNEKYWKLIEAFGKETGIPIVLNTSFNNNAEPIVDSTEDAIVCFLTTGLDYLVANDYIVQKKKISLVQNLSMVISLPRYVVLHETVSVNKGGRMYEDHHLSVTYDRDASYKLSTDIASVIKEANTSKTIGNILDSLGIKSLEKRKEVFGKLFELWSNRLIILSAS